MTPLRTDDVLHKAWLTRLLVAIADDQTLSQNLFFKGGTCAALLGFLDRFSIDLDFDFKKGADKLLLRKEFHRIFKELCLGVDQENLKVLDFLLKYPNEKGKRNTIKLSVNDLEIRANVYRGQFLAEIDRDFVCQTVETMFANKLVAMTDRFKKHGTIAGRDLYDIHHFFLQGFAYESGVIEERTHKSVKSYLIELCEFIKNKVTDQIINEDLNSLLPNERFQKIRKTLKSETLMMVQNEIGKRD